MCGLTAGAPTPVPTSCNNSALAFRRIIAEFQSRQQNIGMVVGIRSEGRTVFREATGWADEDAGTRADPSMAFGIASITKAFTFRSIRVDGRLPCACSPRSSVPCGTRAPKGTTASMRGTSTTWTISCRSSPTVPGCLIANIDDLLAFGVAVRAPGFFDAASLAIIWTQPKIRGVASPMSVGWFPRSDPARISISGSNPGVQATLTVWKDQDLVIAAVANTWGRGSRIRLVTGALHVCTPSRPHVLTSLVP